MAGGKLISTGVEFPDATTQTTSGLPLTGGTMTGDVSLGDNVKAKFGAGDDLKLYHDGTDSRIENETGILFIHQLQASGNTIFYNHNSADVVKNCLQLGGATPNVQLYHNGVQVASTQSGGIAFGTDTAAANTLDDYEEGTFTPVDASGAGLTLTIYRATYTKVGNTVHIFANILYPTTSNSADILISGFPFVAVENGSPYVGPVFVRNSTTPNTAIVNASGQMRIYSHVQARLDNVDVSAAHIFLNFHYTA